MLASKRMLYLEGASGISGDMTVAALLDLGASQEKLEAALESLRLEGYDCVVSRKSSYGLDGVDFDVRLHDHDHDHDHEHEHEHHYDEHGVCSCGHHHHGHDADEVFTSWGMETPKKFAEAEIKTALEALDTGAYGAVLRAKGIVPCTDGSWLHFDMVPGEIEIRRGSADYTGRLCVIGSQLKEGDIQTLFQL